MAELAPELQPVIEQEVLRPRLSDPEWYQQAQCPPDHGDDMVPERRSGRRTKLHLDEAYTIASFCGTCSVREDCLTDALRMGEVDGVRGGLTDWQRKDLHDSYDTDGTVNAARWQEAIEAAVLVRQDFRAKAVRQALPSEAPRTIAATQRRDRLLTLLESQPDATFIVRGESSIYAELGTEVGLSERQIYKLIGGMLAENIVEKQCAQRDARRIIALRLVS